MADFPQYSVITGLTALIKIHTKRFKHYNAAAFYARSTPLKTLFRKYATESRHSVTVLGTRLGGYGGRVYWPELKETSSLWVTLRNFFNAEEINELLYKSEAIERYVLRIHRKAFSLSIVPADTADELRDQTRNCEEAFDTIKMLREKGVNEILVAY